MNIRTYEKIDPQTILKEIEAFKKARDALFEYDAKTDLVIPITIVMMLSTGFWLLMAVGGSTVYYWLKTSILPPREPLKNEFDLQLKKLISRYIRYSEHGAKITKDEFFLKILENISPFLNIQHEAILFPESMRSVDQLTFLSEKYKQILRQMPHRMIIPELLPPITEIESKENFLTLFTKNFINLSTEKKDTSDNIVTKKHSSLKNQDTLFLAIGFFQKTREIASNVQIEFSQWRYGISSEEKDFLKSLTKL